MKNPAIFLSLVLAFAACEKSKSDAEETGDTDLPAAGKRSPTDSVVVTLMEAGAAPRQSLRIKLKEGDSSKLEMRMMMDMSMRAAGAAQPKVKLPVMVATMEIKTRSASEAGYEFDWVVTNYTAEATPGVIPELLTGLRGQLKQLVGVKGTGKIDARGRNLGATFEVPKGVDPQIAQMMEGMKDAMQTMSAPLPDEKVGVGGKWKVNQMMVQNGTKSNVEYIYTIKSIDGDTISTEAELKMVGVPGPIVNKLMPPGVNVNLDSMTGSGSGAITLDLNQAIPVSSTVKMTTKTNTTVSSQGTAQKLDTDMALDIEMKAL